MLGTISLEILRRFYIGGQGSFGTEREDVFFVQERPFSMDGRRIAIEIHYKSEWMRYLFIL